MSYDDMEPRLKPPPGPTWFGFDENMHSRYLAFVKRRMVEVAQTGPAKLREALHAHESELEYTQRELTRARANETRARALIASMTEIIEGSPTDEMIVDEFARLAELDYVIGTRIDTLGRLFVQFRAVVERDGRLYDLGDYEVGFALWRTDASNYPVNVVREVDGASQAYRLSSFRSEGRQNGYRAGYVTVEGHHLRLGKLVEFVEAIRGLLISSALARSHYDFDLPVLGEPEAVWDGFEADPVTAYRQSIRLLKDINPEEVIAQQEHEIASWQGSIARYMGYLRERQAQIRSARAALARATAAAQADVVVDEERVRLDLDQIIQLPGVMGIGFESDDTPIIHLRTSHVLDGRRYDMGDYELYLTQEDRNATGGVIKIRSTRRSPGTLYLQSAGSAGEWFCFGERSGDLEAIFDACDFPQFVHMVINSMNGVNSESDYHGTLNRRFDEIPMAATWQPTDPSERIQKSRGVGQFVMGLLNRS